MSHFRPAPYALLSLSLLLFFGCVERTETKETTAAEVAISLEEQMTIDGADSASGVDSGGGEPILASVNKIATGPEGEIVLFDGESHRILQYAASGAFVNAFGREGRGPEEFQSISCLYVDSRGRIIAVDPGNARFSVFNRQGEMILNQPQLRIRRVTDIKEMPDGRYLVAGWHQATESLLHIMNSDLSRIITSFGSLTDITDSEDESILDILRSEAGHAAVLEQGRIAYAPSPYSGTVYIYEAGAGDDWTLTETREGYTNGEEPVQVLSGPAGQMTALSDIPASRIQSVSVVDQNINVVYEHTLSQGFFRTGKGHLVHLYLRLGEGGAMDMVAERFDGPSVTLNRYGILPLGSGDNLHPAWMNASGELFASQSDTVRVLKMRINGLF